MPDPIITTTHLTRRFAETVAVDRLSLSVEQGEIFGFLGHNGAGKTTTIRMLNGILTASDGQARVLGLDPQADGPTLRRRTGVLTETPSLDERLTGRDNLRFYANLFGIPKAELDRRVDELLTTFDLADRGGDKVASYSKGMKQRLALARALLHKPDLLFLDEPTSGLDPLAARHVHDMVRRMVSADGGTVFLTTHNLVEAQRLCDRVGVMDHGVLVALGKPHELARRLVRNLTIEIEIEPDDRAKAFSALQAGPGKLGEGQRNGSVVVKGAEREAIPQLIGRLVSAGVRIYEVIPQEPSLEDVYFALHGEETSA